MRRHHGVHFALRHDLGIDVVTEHRLFRHRLIACERADKFRSAVSDFDRIVIVRAEPAAPARSRNRIDRERTLLPKRVQRRHLGIAARRGRNRRHLRPDAVLIGIPTEEGVTLRRGRDQRIAVRHKIGESVISVTVILERNFAVIYDGIGVILTVPSGTAFGNFDLAPLLIRRKGRNRKHVVFRADRIGGQQRAFKIERDRSVIAHHRFIDEFAVLLRPALDPFFALETDGIEIGRIDGFRRHRPRDRRMRP